MKGTYERMGEDVYTTNGLKITFRFMDLEQVQQKRLWRQIRREDAEQERASFNYFRSIRREEYEPYEERMSAHAPVE